MGDPFGDPFGRGKPKKSSGGQQGVKKRDPFGGFGGMGLGFDDDDFFGGGMGGGFSSFQSSSFGGMGGGMGSGMGGSGALLGFSAGVGISRGALGSGQVLVFVYHLEAKIYPGPLCIVGMQSCRRLVLFVWVSGFW